MNEDTFMNAIGMIDDRFLDIEISANMIRHRKWRNRISAVAAAAMLIVCPLPTLTAFGFAPAYNILYSIAPSIAQTFKPVQQSCEDNGIEMTVISAKCSENEASVFLAMHDTKEIYPSGEWDLFDSYRINVSYDMTAHCSFSEYDADTHTAHFLVHLETMDGSDMPDSKVTFFVNELLLGKKRFSGKIEGVDMSSVPYEPQTVTRSDISGGSAYDELPDPQEYRFLCINEQPICSPVNGVSIVNIGYIDGALHILTKYDDISNTDNNGYIQLLDKNGKVLSERSEIDFSYWDQAHKNSYTEQIIPVAYDNLSECTLQGDFVTSKEHISGNWEVTFPLE